MKNKTVINLNEKNTQDFIINYLEDKADEIKNTEPYNFYRLNEIRCELKRIFRTDKT